MTVISAERYEVTVIGTFATSPAIPRTIALAFLAFLDPSREDASDDEIAGGYYQSADGDGLCKRIDLITVRDLMVFLAFGTTAESEAPEDIAWLADEVIHLHVLVSFAAALMQEAPVLRQAVNSRNELWLRFS
jgi:hypothetical protein